MQLKPVLRKATELGIGLTAIATLILAGCGGGGDGTAASGAAATVTTTITPYKGRFQSGNVMLRDGHGALVNFTSGGSINASGVATVTYNAGVTYPLTVEVAGTYIDETNGASTTLPTSAPLLGMIPSATDVAASSGIPVTAITHLAREQLGSGYGFSTASAVAAITAAASNVLGVSNYADAMKPPLVNTASGISDPLTLKLTALAHEINAAGSGVALHDKLREIANRLTAGSAVNAVLSQSRFQAAVNALNGGASSVLPTNHPPLANMNLPLLPANTMNNLIAGAIPTCSNGVLTPSPTGLQCVTGSSGTGGGSMSIIYYSGSVVPGQMVTFYMTGLSSTATTSYQVSFGGSAAVTPDSVTAVAGNGWINVTIPNSAASGTLTITNLAANTVATYPNVTVTPKPIVQATCTGGGTTTILPASGVGATSWSNCSNQSPGDVQVVWGNNQFVAAGKGNFSNVIKTSPDGYVWTNGSGNFDRIAFNGTRWIGFISNTSTTAISYSAGADPTSWTSTPITLGSPGQLSNAFAVNGRFFVSTNNDSFLTSTDGIHWTETVSGLCGKGGWSVVVSAGTVSRVLWVNSKYLIYVGDANYQQQLACTSTDGVTWTSTPITAGTAWIPKAFAHDGSKFVATGTTTGSTGVDVWTSADGIAWIKSGYPVPLKQVVDMIWTGSQFIALGSNNQNTNIIDGIAISSDGLNWTAVSSPATSFYTLRSLAYSPVLNRVVSAGAYVPGGLYSSQNGLFVLHQVPAAAAISPLPAPTGLAATATSASQIALSWTAVTGAAGYDVYRSTTPGQAVSAMTKVASAQTATTFTDTGRAGSTTYFYKVVAVVDALTTTAASAEISASTSMSWTNRTPNSAFEHYLTVAWSGSQYVAGSGAYISTSPDGISWTTRATTNVKIYGIALLGSRYVAVGGNTSAVILTSPDGITWSYPTSPTTKPLAAVTCSATRCVAVDWYGSIITSIDGMNWVSQTSGTTVSLYGVAWSGSQFVVVGAGAGAGITLTSPDGITWASHTAGMPVYFGDVTWTGSQFVAVGGSNIYTSADGVTWTSQTSGTTQLLNGITWSGSMLAAVGNAGTILTSPDGIAWTVRPALTTNNLEGIAGHGSQFTAVGYSQSVITSP